MSRPNAQSMKPATAAKKLDVYLPATPEEFQQNPITRDELAALQADPPQWLKDLRKDGPHPKNLVAAKLGVSIAGLARGGVTEALTTEQIEALLEQTGVRLDQIGLVVANNHLFRMAHLRLRSIVLTANLWK